MPSSTGYCLGVRSLLGSSRLEGPGLDRVSILCFGNCVLFCCLCFSFFSLQLYFLGVVAPVCATTDVVTVPCARPAAPQMLSAPDCLGMCAMLYLPPND